MSCCVAEGDAFLVRTAPLYLGVGAILLKRRARFSLAGHAATTYGKFPLRRCSDTDGFKPEGTAVFSTRQHHLGDVVGQRPAVADREPVRRRRPDHVRHDVGEQTTGTSLPLTRSRTLRRIGGRLGLQPKAARTEGPPEGASAPLNQSREALLAVRTLRAAGHPVRNAPIAGCSAQTSRLTWALWRAARNSDCLDDQAPRPAPRCSMSQVGQSTRSWIWCTAHKEAPPGSGGPLAPSCRGASTNGGTRGRSPSTRKVQVG
jgi:hypothetical protein